MFKPGISSGAVFERLKLVLHYGSSISLVAWHRSACFLFILIIIYLLVEWFWLLVPLDNVKPMPKAYVNSLESKPKQASSRVDIGRLQSMHLFGALNQATPVEAAIVDLPKTIEAKPTRLKLQLQGVVMASKSEDALAIIKYQNKEEQYSIGDKLPVARVVLSQVLQDHVILENAGRYESLWLFDGHSDDTKNSVTQARTKAKPISGKRDLRNNSEVKTMAKDYRQRLYKNPASLAEVIRISPHQVDGEMQGYRISPGRDRAQFETLGLKANDIVTSINGVELNDPAKAVEVYKIMRSAREANFLINRQGEQVELVVSLNDD